MGGGDTQAEDTLSLLSSSIRNGNMGKLPCKRRRRNESYVERNLLLSQMDTYIESILSNIGD